MDDSNRRRRKWMAALLAITWLLFSPSDDGSNENSGRYWKGLGHAVNFTAETTLHTQEGTEYEGNLLAASSADMTNTTTTGAGMEKSLPELIDNPDFEDADPQAPDRIRSWEPLSGRGGKAADEAATYEWEKAVSQAGQRSVKISKNREDNIAGVMQQVACLKPGGWYQLTAWLQTTGIIDRPGAGGGANLTVRCQVAGLDNPLFFASSFVSYSQNWQLQKLIFVAPEDCGPMTIILGLQGVKGTVWWDTVSLSEITPPKIAERANFKAGDLDSYGGYKKITGLKSGFFHTQRINDRWWLITPEGHGFIAVGVQCMSRKGREAREIEHVRNMPTRPANAGERFEILNQLAQVTANNLNLPLNKIFPEYQKREIKALVASGDARAPEKVDAAFSQIGELIHNSPEQQKWIQASCRRLKTWGFNLVSHNVLFKNMAYDLAASPSLWGFPFIAPEVWVPARIGRGTFPRQDNPTELFGFPDVFDRNFSIIFEQEFKKIAACVRNDPYLLGYFLGNELTWGGNLFDSFLDMPLFDMFMALSPERPGKQAVVTFLRQRYGNNPQSFAATWGVSINNFDELLSMKKLGKGVIGERCSRDRSDFLRLTAYKYFRTCHQIIKKYDPNHLILGVRFIGVHSVPLEVMETMGKFVDVVSFNAYDLLPPIEALEQSYAFHCKPMLITEFSFKAMDSGLKNSMGQGFILKTQKDRALWYERYVTLLLSSPHIVGFTWYKDVDDQPFQKGEVCNYGLMTGSEVPYDILIEKVVEVNRKVYSLAATAREK